MNLNQLTKAMDWEYKSVRHHVRVLVTNSLFVSSGKKYGSVYRLSPWFEYHVKMFEEMCNEWPPKTFKKTERIGGPHPNDKSADMAITEAGFDPVKAGGMNGIPSIEFSGDLNGKLFNEHETEVATRSETAVH